MNAKRRTSLLIDDALMRKARKALHAPTNSEAVTRALEEAVANKDVETSLKALLRRPAPRKENGAYYAPYFTYGPFTIRHRVSVANEPSAIERATRAGRFPLHHSFSP